jgi:hypothetical protein
VEQRLAAWAIDERDFPHTGTATEKLRFLLGYAVLAPSSHNSQPWRFRIDRDCVELYEDVSRALPVVDPQRRELLISCGAALQFLLIALRRFGVGARLEPRAEAGPGPLARVCVAGSAPDAHEDEALVRAMTLRRTNRAAFEQRPIPAAVLGRLEEAAREFDTALIQIPAGSEREEAAALIEEATRVQFADPAYRAELARWMTSNRGGRPDGMPGYAHGLGDIPSLLGPLLMRRINLGMGQAAKDRQKALDAPVLALLSTPADGRSDALRAGQALALILLRARVEGIWASFFNAPVELPVTRRRLSRLVEDGAPQLLLRLGYAPAVRPTPRRAVDDVVS